MAVRHWRDHLSGVARVYEKMLGHRTFRAFAWLFAIFTVLALCGHTSGIFKPIPEDEASGKMLGEVDVS